jgi:hypothetical protein
VIEIFNGIETLEMHNNVFYRMGGGAVTILQLTDVTWAAGNVVMNGLTNWAPTGSKVPTQWTQTIFGDNPKFAAIAPFDLRPAAGSPLRDKATSAPPSPAGYGFPSPLAAPGYVPPVQKVAADVTTLVRTNVGTMDLGAYEGATATLVQETIASQEVQIADKSGQARESAEEMDLEEEAEEAGIACSFGRTGASGLGAWAFVALWVLRRRMRARASGSSATCHAASSPGGSSRSPRLTRP